MERICHFMTSHVTQDEAEQYDDDIDKCANRRIRGVKQYTSSLIRLHIAEWPHAILNQPDRALSVSELCITMPSQNITEFDVLSTLHIASILTKSAESNPREVERQISNTRTGLFPADALHIQREHGAGKAGICIIISVIIQHITDNTTTTTTTSAISPGENTRR